jgi:arginyl-tRNA synthetase
MQLAVEESSQNPVYYVQYAHARICSILKNLKSEGYEPEVLTAEELAVLTSSEERELIRYLGQLPSVIKEASKSYDSSKITKFAVETAALFHKFYNAKRVKGEDAPILKARLKLCDITRSVLKNVLGLIKVDAPVSM